MEKRIDMRTRILACILFACFEAYHGNTNEAVSQMVAGTEMVREYMGARAAWEHPQAACYVPPLEEPVYMIFAVVEVQAMTFGTRRRYELVPVKGYASLTQNPVNNGTWRE